MKNPFLDKSKIAENDLSFSIYDDFPVSKGHSLIIPKRIVPDIFDLNKYEYQSCFELVKTVKKILKKRFNPGGFNIGVNCGKTAGQSIFHAHIHVIPRYKGDVINPAGGVRRVIPYKNHQFFKNKKYTKRKVYL